MIYKKINNKTNILKKIYIYKHSTFGKIIIPSSFYELKLLTFDCLDNSKIIHLLSVWRKNNSNWFPSQFKVTDEGTKKWFRNNVIMPPTRLLFIIIADNDYIGHVGLNNFNFDIRTCELDNIVRGSSKYPGIMSNAVMKLMKWGRKELNIDKYLLRVLSDNKKATNFYQRLGFIKRKIIPLKCIKSPGRIDWIEDSSQSKATRYYLEMIES